MRWKEFLKVAYPLEIAQEEARKSWVWRLNRWVGLRTSYVLHCLGVSGDLLSVFRLIMAMVSMFLLSHVKTGEISWLPFLGVLLLTWQVHLDFSDGALARARGNLGPLGDHIDGIANSMGRLSILVLLGYLADDTYLLIVSVSVAYVLVASFPSNRIRLANVPWLMRLALFYRIARYVPFMLIVLPLVLVLLPLLAVPVVLPARIALCCYGALAIVVLFFYAFGRSALEASIVQEPEANSRHPQADGRGQERVEKAE